MEALTQKNKDSSLRPNKLWRAVYKFILISIAVHVVGLLIFGGFIIFQRLQPEPVQFEKPVRLPKVEPKKREYKMRIKEQQQRASRPKLQPRLQSLAPAPLALPTIDTKITPVKSELADLPGLADGIGDGLGFGGGIGEFTIFGYTRGAPGSLQGNLYDLKLSRNGKDIPNGKGGVGRHVNDLVNSKTLGISFFNREFYRAEKSLFASFWVLPMISAAEAPKAFSVENEVEPSALVLVYSGSYIPNDSGQFRFYGKADDILIVRVNGEIVLDASLNTNYSDWEANQSYQDDTRASHFDVNANGIYGDWFRMNAGQQLEIEVIVGEVPGGGFGYWLTIQKEGRKPKFFTTKKLSPKERKFLKELHPDSGDFL